MEAILVGFGFIGRSFLSALKEKIRVIEKTFPNFKLTGAANKNGYVFDENGLDLAKLSGLRDLIQYPGRFIREPAVELIERSGADVLIEATPTNIVDGEPGLTHIVKAVENGMDVVTSNKGPFVVAFGKIMKLAEKRGVEVLYEATVGGAIPIFSLARNCLRGSRITRVQGILNGTTNYILSKMHFEEIGFEEALREAQEKGLAETDPSYDVDGIDAGCKIVILANALLGKNITIRDVKIRGIREVTMEEIIEAKRKGMALKLVAEAGEEFKVETKPIPLDSSLCVHGSLNAVRFETDLAGEIIVIGHGAGRETVAAMINDLLSLRPR
ncbi:MAG: homoserine dehydrogenase [Thaumarchaeota archaeon]|nr:homoserine dehydrogenase [Nitrososphaerota archaeon]